MDSFKTCFSLCSRLIGFFDVFLIWTCVLQGFWGGFSFADFFGMGGWFA